MRIVAGIGDNALGLPEFGAQMIGPKRCAQTA
jgi:hypothetical protein